MYTFPTTEKSRGENNAGEIARENGEEERKKRRDRRVPATSPLRSSSRGRPTRGTRVTLPIRSRNHGSATILVHLLIWWPDSIKNEGLGRGEEGFSAGRGDRRHEGNGFPLEDEEWIRMTEVVVKREI